MAVTGGDVVYRFTGDTSGLSAAVRQVAAEQQAAAAVAAKSAETARAALEAERAATVKVSEAERALAVEMQKADAAAKAKAATLGISVTQLRQVETATQKAAAATASAAATTEAGAAGFDKLSGTIGKTAQVSGALGGVISRIDPALGATVSSVGGLAGAFQGLTGAGVLTTAMLGPLAVAVGIAAGAFLYFKHDLDEAEAAQKKWSDTATEAQKTAGTWESVLSGIDEKWRVSTKQTTSAGVETEKQIKALNDAFQAQAKEAKATASSEDDAARKISALTERYATAYTHIKETQAIEERGTGTRKQNTAATDDAAVALRKYEEAQRAIAQAMQEDSRLNGVAASAIAELDKANQDATRAALDGVEAEEAARDAALAHTLEVYQRGVEAASGQADELRALWKSYEAARASISETSAGKIATIREKEAEDAIEATRKRVREERQLEMQKSSAIADIAGSTHDLLIMYAESQAKENRKAALAAFYAAQAVAAFQAGVNTALAITNALATVPYPAAPFVAAAAGVAGAVEIGTILSQKPSFHAGGMLYPDEGNATLLRGEPVINRQAAARAGLDNPAAVADFNNSGAGGPSLGGVTMLKVGRLEAREIIHMDVASGGLVVQTARTAAAGGGQLAGRTGRRPMA